MMAQLRLTVGSATDSFTEADWEIAERFTPEVLAGGVSPSAAARRARTTTPTARRILGALAADRLVRTSGNGAWTHFHPW